MRLHNRQVKAGFWNDSELLKHFNRDGRLFYQGLWHLADDSGCIENDPFGYKIHLFPGDIDITPEILASYRDKLISLNKLIKYSVNGKEYLYIKNFHEHQKIKNSNKPTIPLPKWISWEPYNSNPYSGKYIVKPVPDEYINNDLDNSYKVLSDNLESSTNLKPLTFNCKPLKDTGGGNNARACENTKKNQQENNKEIPTEEKNQAKNHPEEKNTAIEHYEQNIGFISSSVLMQIESYKADGVDDGLIIKAIDQACIHNAKKWSYIRAILNDCIGHDIYTEKQFEIRQKEWERKKRCRSPANKQKDKKNFEQRNYDDSFFESLYENQKKEGPS